jgi:hypothetical protein
MDIFCNIMKLHRGATGAARAPKLDKTPNTAVRRRCRRHNLFYKIKVRPRSCRSYPIWRACYIFLKLKGSSLLNYFLVDATF